MYWLMMVCVISLLIAGATVFTGCTNSITLPRIQSSQSSINIALLDYGRHSSLVLPASDDGGAIEFAYGEWEWYALQRDSMLRILPTLAIPTQGTIGQNRWDQGDAQWVGETKHELGETEAIYIITVESHLAESLVTQLQDRYNRNAESARISESYGLTFVPDERAYWLFHNCNHEVVDWLRQLGCTIKGNGIYSDFKIHNDE